MISSARLELTTFGHPNLRLCKYETKAAQLEGLDGERPREPGSWNFSQVDRKDMCIASVCNSPDKLSSHLVESFIMYDISKMLLFNSFT